MKSLRSAISQEKVPYLVTIFFVSLGWVVTHSVEQMESSPTIMYKITVQESADNKIMQAHIQNITRDKAFRNLQFAFFLDASEGKLIKAQFIQFPPAYGGRIAPVIQGNSLSFQIDKMQPGWQFDLGAQYKGQVAPEFRLTNSEESSNSGILPVRLVTPSIETFFVLHEFTVMSVVLACYCLAILLILFGGTASDQGLKEVEPRAVREEGSNKNVAC